MRKLLAPNGETAIRGTFADWESEKVAPNVGSDIRGQRAFMTKAAKCGSEKEPHSDPEPLGRGKLNTEAELSLTPLTRGQRAAKTRHEALTPQQRSEIASIAARARWKTQRSKEVTKLVGKLKKTKARPNGHMVPISERTK